MDAATGVGLDSAVSRSGGDGSAAGGGGDVLLATFDVPFDVEAARFAVDTAVETGHSLIVANVVELPPLPMSVVLGYDTLDYSPELAASLREPVDLAYSLGVHVERLRVKSFRRVEALVELVKERRIGLLVLGPDRKVVGRRLYNRAARAVRDELSCLVWLSWELPRR